MSEDIKNSKNDSSDQGSQEKKKAKKRSYRYKLDPTDVEIGDFQININRDMVDIDPFKLIEKLYLLHNNQDLTKEEKELKLRRIMRKLSI